MAAPIAQYCPYRDLERAGVQSVRPPSTVGLGQLEAFAEPPLIRFAAFP